MNTERYVRELNACKKKDYVASMNRNEPTPHKKAKRDNPVTTLEKHLLGWPPRDVRFDESYLEDHEFESTDSEFMIDVADGMVLKVIERIPKDNSIIIGVYLQSNLAEFERYNLVVNKHNYEWTEQGSPEDVFDPITGDLSNIKDTIVREVEADSPYRSSPEYQISDGPLAKASPKTKRDLYAKIKFRLDTINGMFKMGFVARDAKDRVIFYDTLKHEDVAYLSRRAIHELFGNPFVYGTSGALLDGIAYLIQGKKLPLCHKNNEIPNWPEMKDAVCKDSNPALALSSLNQIFYRIGGIAFGYIIPIYIFWTWIIVKTYRALLATNTRGSHDADNWMIIVILSCVSIVISFLIAKYCYRKTNVEKLTSKLL
jgi:hypothetical protein